VTTASSSPRPANKKVEVLGNVIAPQDVIKQSGAIFCAWSCATDYWDDQRIGRRSQTTSRPIAAAQHAGVDARQPGAFRAPTALPPEKCRARNGLMLHRLAELDLAVPPTYAIFDYKRIFARSAGHDGRSLAFYSISARTRSIATRSRRRRASLSTVLVICSAPSVTGLRRCSASPPRGVAGARSRGAVVHLSCFRRCRRRARRGIGGEMAEIRTVRRVVTGALEIERAQKRTRLVPGSCPIVYSPDPDLFRSPPRCDLASLDHLACDAG